MDLNTIFRRLASKISQLAGSPYTFILAICLIVTWGISGPFFNYSNTWQLAVNTLTTVVTFLMVFLIQNTQNRDSRAIHLKLDELIKGTKGARDKVVNVEELPDEIMDEMHQEFRDLQTKYTQKVKATKPEKIKGVEMIFTTFYKMLGK